MGTSIWVTIASSLFSGLAAYGVSTYFYVRHEKRKQKFEVFRNLIGNRHGLTPGGNEEANAKFFQALNEAVAVFYDSKSVLTAIQDFKKYPNRASDNVTQLIRRMCEDLKIDVSFLDDDFFNSPFVPANRQINT